LQDRDAYGNTLLHEAAGGRGFANTPCLDFVRWLIEQKLDVNARGLSDNTPLMAAIVGKQREAIRLLLAAGADRSLKNEGGVDAIELAEHQAPKLLPLLRAPGPVQKPR
jgi:ankyrin repeat protein